MKRVACLLLLLACCAAFAQDPAPDKDAAALEAARKRLAARAEPQTPEDRLWVEALQNRVGILERIVRTSSQHTDLASGDDLGQRRTKAEAEIEVIRGEAPPEAVELSSTDEVPAYDRAQTAAKADQVRADSALKDLKSKLEQGRKEIAGLPDREAAVREGMSKFSGEDELSRYRIETARSEVRLIGERIAYLTEALEAWAAEVPVAQLEFDLAKLKAERAASLLELARTQATSLREAEVQVGRRQAEAETRKAEREEDPIERFRLRVRAEITTLRAETIAQANELDGLKQALVQEREAVKRIEAERKILEDRLRLRPSGADDLLRRSLSRARRADALLDEVLLPDVYVRREENQRELADLLDVRWDVDLPPAENPYLQELLADVGEAHAEEALGAFRPILEEEGFLDALQAREEGLEAADAFYGELGELVTERNLALEEFREFIRGSLIWSRSDSPISFGTFAGAVTEMGRIRDPYRERDIWPRFLSGVGSRVPLVILVIVALVGLQLLLRRIDRRRGEPQPSKWRAWLPRAVRGLTWAAIPPAQLWIIGATIHAVGGPEAFDPPFATFLAIQALLVLIRRSSETTLGENGLLVGERGIAPEVGLQINRVLRFATLASQILYAPFRVLSGKPFHFEDLPRLLEIVWTACMVLAMLHLFRWNGAIVCHWTRPGTMVRKLVRGFWTLNVVFVIPDLLLDALGYRVVSEMALVNSFRIYLAMFVMGAVFRTLERAGPWLATKIAPKTKKEGEDARVLEARDNALAVLSRVAAYVVIAIIALSLREWWSIGEPLYRLLDSIRLAEVDPEQYLTAWQVLVGLTWIVGGHFLASNLAKIHEAIVIPLAGTGQVGGRYAALALARYGILLASYAAGLLTVGFSFQALGWFMTAASVGLGFGLQEIVANFISGLILLFEGPIRVGDIVTIGSTSGTVDKITIRATVVTNWDRQTIIIPNKKFVTENLTNWTRNDRVMRRTIPVRVAYGTDVERVLAILHEVVKSHPEVLEDPPSRIWFQSFGEFGIEFQVLFFTSIDVGLSTRSEVHAAINARFAKEGIRIPIVQRDLRVSGQEEAGPPLPSTG